MKKIDNRREKILHMVIQEFVKTARPVSSKLLCQQYELDCSPATIRNELADLEEEGFLTHPHTSAGRIPTDKGYRHYVDTLMEIQRLTQDEEKRIKNEFESKTREFDDIMRETSKLLALVSHHAGFVLSPNIGHSFVQHIELIKLDGPRLLVIIVTKDGLVKHKILPVEKTINDNRIKHLSRILNEKLIGSQLFNIQEKITKELEKEHESHKEILNIAKILEKEFLSLSDKNLFYIEGTSNIFDIHQEKDNIKSIYKVIEQENMLSDILTLDLKDGIQVSIGHENLCKEMNECSLVKSTYKIDGKTIGVLGIIGPKRMEYSKMIALVDFISKIMGKLLTKK
jgi:heat-inducible transcriptional repressor